MRNTNMKTAQNLHEHLYTFLAVVKITKSEDDTTSLDCAWPKNKILKKDISLNSVMIQ
jgi:hypothetical protein